jgi:hypothetical protein
MKRAIWFFYWVFTGRNHPDHIAHCAAEYRRARKTLGGENE